jgi:hypothetical protein
MAKPSSLHKVTAALVLRGGIAYGGPPCSARRLRRNAYATRRNVYVVRALIFALCSLMTNGQVAPKKVKAEIKNFTQDELIARALDTEEGNIIEHRDYLTLEEEKRRKARVVRPSIEGPLLRWVSRVETVEIKPPPPPPPKPHFQTSSQSQAVPAPAPAPARPQPRDPQHGFNPAFAAAYSSYLYPGSSSSSHATGHAPLSVANRETNVGSSSEAMDVDTELGQPRTERVARNYVMHELGQTDITPPPMWDETMTAMFGDHVEWRDLKVYVNKGRPLCKLYSFPDAWRCELTLVQLNSTSSAVVSPHRVGCKVS